MLHFNDLSFWEKQTILTEIDFVVMGGGIVGIACAVELRKLHPTAKIVLLERGYLSTGASTKNAGFACFGSVTELIDDLQTMSEDAVWETVALRYEGLIRLTERFNPSEIEFKTRGSWDLITKSDESNLPTYDAYVPYLNNQIERITGNKNCFSYDTSIANRAGFQSINGGFFNQFEGELDTGKLILASNRLLAENNIIPLYGIEVKRLDSALGIVTIETNFGTITSRKVALTVNGFANQFLGDERVQPARAQVIVTEPIPGFELPGTFHYQKGYYYFRSIGNRILLGGGRNLNFEGETTTTFEQTDQIITALKSLLHEVIFPTKKLAIDYKWSGIMGVGTEKKPIIERHNNIGIGVRMGGMGVAIGSIVGERLAEVLSAD
jgi:glycine/D-amino acid oxidase-like deaminating enzyme